MRKFIGLVIAVFALSWSGAIAQTVVSGSQYTAVIDVVTQSNNTISMGSRVEALGVIDVSTDVMPSGNLFTFLYEENIYNADMSSFSIYKVSEQIDIAPTFSENTPTSSSLCTTLRGQKSRDWVTPTSVSFRDYIRVSANGVDVSDFSVRSPDETDGDLCISNLKFSTDYSVTLLEGMTYGTCSDWACEGEDTLSEDVTYFGSTADVDPSISLDTGKTILPLSDLALIPVTTINISSIDVEVMRVDERTISSARNLFFGLDNWDSNRLRNWDGEILGRKTIKISGEPGVEQSFNVDVSSIIDTDEPGLYVAIFDAAELGIPSYEAKPTQWFMRTNIGVAVYSGASETKIELRKFDDLQTVTGASVEIIAANNRMLFEGISDESGSVVVPVSALRGEGGNAPKFIVVKTGAGDFSLLDISNLKSKPRFLNGGVSKGNLQDVYLTTDRDLYRVGDDIHYVAIGRSLDLSQLDSGEFNVVVTGPRGKELNVSSAVVDENGMFSGSYNVKETAYLGAYTIELQSKDETRVASVVVNVDDFVPLTIETEVAIESDIWQDGPQSFTVNSSYYSGGVAGGLRGDYFWSVKKVRSIKGDGLEGFEFGTIEDLGKVLFRDDGDFQLDEGGKFTGSVLVDFGYADAGLYELFLKSSVRDVGGRPNSKSITIPLDPYNSYIGVRSRFDGVLDIGSYASFDVIATDRAGKALDNGEMTYVLSRISYSYNWYYDQGWHWRRNRRGSDVIAGGRVEDDTILVGEALRWGSYELSVVDAHGAETTSEFYVGWGANGETAATPDELTIFVDTNGEGGDVLRFNAPFNGVATISIAAADILSSTDVAVERGSNEISVELPSDIEPGFHVLVTMRRAIETGSEHLPQIAIGSAWVETLDEGRRIEMDVQTSGSIRSFEPVHVKLEVSEDRGSAIMLLVDEGIHAINSFENADLLEHFYGERALDFGLLNNYGQLIEQDRMLDSFSVGGDGEASASSQAVAKSEFFKTVAEVSPLLAINNGTVEYEFDATEFEGRVRLVVLVASETGLAIDTQDITIVDPVSVDISLPRFVALGDSITAKMGLRANESVSDITISNTVGDATVRSTFDLVQGQSFRTDLEFTPEMTGSIPVSVNASYGDISVSRDFDIVSRYASYPHSELYSFGFTPSKWSWAGKINVPPLEADNFEVQLQDDLELRVTLGALPGAGLAQVLAALDRYPYGCIEQTSSTTRGLIFREQLGGDNLEDRGDKINYGLEGIMAKQKSDGSFGYWDRFDRVVDKYQPYAIETLVMGLPYAKDEDAVRRSIRKGLEYIYRHNDGDLQAKMYSYGLLAESGYEVTSRVRYAVDVLLKNELDTLETKLLASAAKILRLTEEKSQLENGFGTLALQADRLINRQVNSISRNNTQKVDHIMMAYWLADVIDDTKRLGELTEMLETAMSFPSAYSVVAQQTLAPSIWQNPRHILGANQIRLPYTNASEFLARISDANRTEEIQALIDATSASLVSQKYRSTYTNAKLASILLNNRFDASGLSVAINGDERFINQDGTIEISLEEMRDGFQISQTHQIDRPVYLNAEVVGRRSTTGSIDNGFTIYKILFDESGREVPVGRNDVRVKQGDVFTVVLEISAGQGLYGDALLTDLLPSGFEIESGDIVSMTDDEMLPLRYEDGANQVFNIGQGKIPAFVQKMDDRYMASFEGSWGRKTTVVYYTIRAVYPGDMVLPDAHIEYMYRPDINGRSHVRQIGIDE